MDTSPLEMTVLGEGLIGVRPGKPLMLTSSSSLLAIEVGVFAGAAARLHVFPLSEDTDDGPILTTGDPRLQLGLSMASLSRAEAEAGLAGGMDEGVLRAHRGSRGGKAQRLGRTGSSLGVPPLEISVLMLAALKVVATALLMEGAGIPSTLSIKGNGNGALDGTNAAAFARKALLPSESISLGSEILIARLLKLGIVFKWKGVASYSRVRGGSESASFMSEGSRSRENGEYRSAVVVDVLSMMETGECADRIGDE